MNMDEEDCPFDFGDDEAPAPEHPTIGVCALCGGDAKTKFEAALVCFGCAYHMAN